MRLCRRCRAESLWLSVLCIFYTCEATPRRQQGCALPKIKGALAGKAEPFRTARAAQPPSFAYVELKLNSYHTPSCHRFQK
jgi:hypothetical protein